MGGRSMTSDAWIRRGRPDNDRRSAGDATTLCRLRTCEPGQWTGQYHPTSSDRALFSKLRAALPDDVYKSRRQRKLTPEILETGGIGHPLRLGSGKG